jgi:hypothetical protein
MEPVSVFERKNQSAMMDYIVMISSPRPVDWTTNLTPGKRDPIRDAAVDRISHLTVLHQEGIPTFPRMFDVAKTLAAVTSAVIRSARCPRPPPFSSQLAPPGNLGRIENFAILCLSVEGEALKAVARLDPHGAGLPASGEDSRPHTPSDLTHNQSNVSLSAPSSPRMVFSQDTHESGSSTSGGKKHSRQVRPSSAPSTICGESNDSLTLPTSEGPSVTSQPDHRSSSLPITRSPSVMYPAVAESAPSTRPVETQPIVGPASSYSQSSIPDVGKKARALLGALRMKRNKNEQ